MQKVFRSLLDIEEVVKELLPPSKNKFIGLFEMKFLISSLDYSGDEEATFIGERNITYKVKIASLEEELFYLKECFFEDYEYVDNHNFWKAQSEIRERIKLIESKL